MRDKLECYQIWTPVDALWTQWVKPVLFMTAFMNETIQLESLETNWISPADGTVAVIIDRQGVRGIEEGLALAKLGYRPVPLYNGVPGPSANASIVNTRELSAALYKGADELANIHILPEAPPVFLLDANRMSGRGRQPGKFDNRWCIFPQDMPSAAFLKKQGINRVVVRTDSSGLQSDLVHILCRYQEGGIGIQTCREGGQIENITIAKPFRFRSLFYRFQIMAGLKRNAAGGFGGIIPEPMEGGSGYHRMG